MFFASGASFGFLTQSRREIEGESQKWFDQSTDLNCVANLDGNFLRVNEAFGRLLGYRTSDLLGTSYLSYVHPDDVESTVDIARQLAEGKEAVEGFENRYRKADGSYRWLRWSSTADHRRRRLYASARDVTETKELEAELRELAQTDSLTGLLNRRAFESEAERQLDFLRCYGPGGAVMVFDIDRFKDINDAYGHSAGDEALQRVSAVITGRKRATDTAARIGGDEFAILFPGAGENEAKILATGLLVSIREQTVRVEGSSVPITSSIGVAVFAQAAAGEIASLLAHADRAMYTAKRAGGDQCAFATSDVLQ